MQTCQLQAYVNRKRSQSRNPQHGRIGQMLQLQKRPHVVSAIGTIHFLIINITVSIIMIIIIVTYRLKYIMFCFENRTIRRRYRNCGQYTDNHKKTTINTIYLTCPMYLCLHRKYSTVQRGRVRRHHCEMRDVIITCAHVCACTRACISSAN